MSPETVELDDVDDLCGISYEQDRTEDGTLRDTGSDCHCPGQCPGINAINLVWLAQEIKFLVRD